MMMMLVTLTNDLSDVDLVLILVRDSIFKLLIASLTSIFNLEIVLITETFNIIILIRGI